MHPVNPSLAVTVGDDHTVRMWDVATNTLVKVPPTARGGYTYKMAAYKYRSPWGTTDHSCIIRLTG